jgi:hypothetical protein
MSATYVPRWQRPDVVAEIATLSHADRLAYWKSRNVRHGLLFYCRDFGSANTLPVELTKRAAALYTDCQNKGKETPAHRKAFDAFVRDVRVYRFLQDGGTNDGGRLVARITADTARRAYAERLAVVLGKLDARRARQYRATMACADCGTDRNVHPDDCAYSGHISHEEAVRRAEDIAAHVGRCRSGYAGRSVRRVLRRLAGRTRARVMTAKRTRNMTGMDRSGRCKVCGWLTQRREARKRGCVLCAINRDPTLRAKVGDYDGTEGQDRESYSDTQDRDNYGA